jgi:hypothetical protein
MALKTKERRLECTVLNLQSMEKKKLKGSLIVSNDIKYP